MDAIQTTFHLTPDETAYVEACLARRRELMALAATAPDGHVLARCEEATVELARTTGHDLLAAALAGRVAVAEQKKGQPEPATAVAGGTTAAPTPGRSSRRSGRSR
jgi:hypothetical protein